MLLYLYHSRGKYISREMKPCLLSSVVLSRPHHRNKNSNIQWRKTRVTEGLLEHRKTRRHTREVGLETGKWWTGYWASVAWWLFIDWGGTPLLVSYPDPTNVSIIAWSVLFFRKLCLNLLSLASSSTLCFFNPLLFHFTIRCSRFLSFPFVFHPTLLTTVPYSNQWADNLR